MNTVQKTLKDSPAVRWLVLVLISAIIFSTYWFYDFYGSLKGLMESELGFSSEEYGRIMGMTTIANMFGMIMVGGFILDKWGIRIAGMLFGGIATLGAIISALATAKFFGDDHGTMLNMMILGRILFGSGLEVICVVSTRAAVKWFKGYELALALAINMGFGRLGTAMGMALSLDIGGGHVAPAFAFAAALVGLTLLLLALYLIFDVKLDRQIQAGKESDPEDEFKFSDLVKLISDRSFLFITLLCLSFYAAVFPFMAYAPDLLINKFGFTSEMAAEGNIILFGSETLGNASVYIVFFVMALAFSVIPDRFPKSSTRLIFKGAMFVVLMVYLYSIGDQLSLWFQNGAKAASLIPVGTILFSPIFGDYVDKKGKAASLMVLGSLLLIIAHLSLSVFNNVYFAYIGLLSLGIAFSLVPAAMWPAVAKIVPESRLGTAYSTMFTIQNWGLGAFFYGIGAMLDYVNRSKIDEIRAGNATYDYTIPVLILVGCGVISIFLAYKLKAADKKQGYGLELPSGAVAPKDEK